MRPLRAFLGVCLVVAACRGGGNGGTRAPEHDQHCEPGKPHAYEFGDQAAAERAGCGVKRVHRGVPDPKTGQTREDEIWVFCCAR